MASIFMRCDAPQTVLSSCICMSCVVEPVGMGSLMVYWLSETLNSTTGQNSDLRFNFRSQIKSQGQIQVILPGGWERLGEYEVRECGRSTISHPAS